MEDGGESQKFIKEGSVRATNEAKFHLSPSLRSGFFSHHHCRLWKLSTLFVVEKVDWTAHSHSNIVVTGDDGATKVARFKSFCEVIVISDQWSTILSFVLSSDTLLVLEVDLLWRAPSNSNKERCLFWASCNRMTDGEDAKIQWGSHIGNSNKRKINHGKTGEIDSPGSRSENAALLWSYFFTLCHASLFLFSP